MWTNNDISKPGSYTLYNVAAQTFTRITPPSSSVKYVSNGGYEFVGVGGGYVVYAEAGKTYSWNSVSGAKVLLLDAVPEQIFVDGNQATFTVKNSVYRIVLR